MNATHDGVRKGVDERVSDSLELMADFLTRAGHHTPTESRLLNISYEGVRSFALGGKHLRSTLVHISAGDVVDVKTGKNTISVAAGQDHAQLATYQLALALGGVPGLGNVEPGGGALVYVNNANGKTGAAQRNQDPLTEEQIDEWLAVVRSAAYRSIGPTFEATINDGCGHCPLTASCPAQLDGRMVTDG